MMSVEASSRVDLRQVCAWLDVGYEIEEPIVQQSAYYTRRGRVCVLELVLNSCGQRRVVALDDLPEVQRFLKQRRLTVLDLQ